MLLRTLERRRGRLRRIGGTKRYGRPALPARLMAGMAALLLAACGHAPDRGAHRDDASQCVAPDSAECAAARERFQVVRYPTFRVDQLVVAASRALGDLNFEAERDDRNHRVSGEYVAAAPVHKGQFDELFRKNLKQYGAAPLMTAQVEITPLAQQDTGAEVRLRLFAPQDGAAPQPVDSVAPYQVFFSQLGAELGAPAAPPPPQDNPRERRRQAVPSISGV